MHAYAEIVAEHIRYTEVTLIVSSLSMHADVIASPRSDRTIPNDVGNSEKTERVFDSVRPVIW